MSGVVTSRVDPPDHLPRLAVNRPWYGGSRGAYAAFGRDTSLVWRVAGCVCGVWPGYVRKRRSQRAGRGGRLGTSADRALSGRRLGWSKAPTRK